MNAVYIAQNVVFLAKLLMGGGMAIFGALAIVTAVRGKQGDPKATEVLSRIAIGALAGFLLFTVVQMFIGDDQVNMGGFVRDFFTTPLAPETAPAPTPSSSILNPAELAWYQLRHIITRA